MAAKSTKGRKKLKKQTKERTTEYRTSGRNYHTRSTCSMHSACTQ